LGEAKQFPKCKIFGLITSLYSRLLVKGSEATVGTFRRVARKLKLAPSKPLTIPSYIQLTLTHNDIFTFHTNDILSEALDKAILISQNANLPAAPPNDISPEFRPVPGAEINAVANDSISELQNPPPDVEQITVIEDRGIANPQLPAIFGTVDPLNTDLSHSNDCEIPQKSNAPLAAFKSPNAVPKNRKTISGPQRRRSEKCDGNVYLLRDLTKRNRKLYKSTAKEVIKLANLSNKPELQKMAKFLKMKMGNGSITTHDVHSLQAAVGTATNQDVMLKQQVPQPRNSLKNNYDKAFEFHRDL